KLNHSGLFDEALFVLIGDQWKRHRKLLQPAFAPSHLKHTAKVTIETMAKLFNILDHQLKTTGQLQVNMHHIMTTCALEIIGKVAFGESLGVVDKLSTEESTRFITPRWLWRFLGVSNHTYKIKTAKLNVMTYFQSIATKRSIQIANNAHPQDHEMDILYRLLLAKQKGLMTQDEIMGEIVGFFLAGHETTANTITSCIYDLCMNPEIMESVYKSVSDVDESDINHLLDQLTKLRYLDNVLKESQRLRPVITQLTRISNRTVDVLGHQFPSNTIFILNLYAIQLDGRYYDKPMEFKPDRFDEQLEVGAFMPFGDGQHNCIGQKMAMIELKIMLVMMIKRYRISLVEGLPVEFEMSMTRGLKKGLIVNLEKRD
ncbi:cytochrome P450, partial [Globomyces pollinis-pini]